MPSAFVLPADILDIALRLVAAMVIGMALGLERALRGKATGMRTLGLVSLSATLVAIAMAHAQGILALPDAYARVLQGVEQGVLVGVGFLGAGVIVRDPATNHTQNLTTAAEVWAVAAMGLATAVAPWVIVGIGVMLFVILIVACRVLETKFGLKDHS